MAIAKTLLGKIAARNNLENAWLDISRFTRPQSHGASNQTIENFRSNYKENLEVIRKELLSGSYKFGKVRGVTIEKKGGKKRPLRIADIKDRVVQRAMALVLEKYLGKKYYLNNPASHAYLKKRNIQSAIKQMLKLHQKGFLIILEADIVDFFGTVNVRKLLDEMVFPVLPDATLNDLIEQAFSMEIGNKKLIPQEDWSLFPDSASGLPQGGYLSPLFSNVYLATFDQSMIEGGYNLIRYADDFIVMCESNNEAEDAYKLVTKILVNDLGLKLHPRTDGDKSSKTRVVSISGNQISFLGVDFNGTRLRPSSDKRKKLSEKLLARCNEAETVKDLLISVKNLIEGWVSAYGFTDIDDVYLKKVDNEINKLLFTALANLGWRLKVKPITDIQRENSGIASTIKYRDKVRNRLDAKERSLLSKYWK